MSRDTYGVCPYAIRNSCYFRTLIFLIDFVIFVGLYIYELHCRLFKHSHHLLSKNYGILKL